MSAVEGDLERVEILHVEDSEADAKILHLSLRKENSQNHVLHRVESLESALVFLESKSCDLILLDLFLPDSNGLDTLTRIKAHTPDVAIIVLTGVDDESIGLQAVKHGAQDYIVKDELTSRLILRAIRYSVERHNYDKKLVEMARVDLLTGLPNRISFVEYLEQSIVTSKRLKSSISLLFIDFDHFKLINDTFGHVKGDEFLTCVASLLKKIVRATDFIARFAGDEFLIVLHNQRQEALSPKIVAEKIVKNLNIGIAIPTGESFDARCSIGITTYDGKSNTPSTDKLIQEADAAMYLSKQKGGNCISFFDQKLEKKAERRLSLLRDLNMAIRNKEFYLCYQPIYSPVSDVPAGLEALLRWRNHKNEVISPAEFIPLLEESGLIQPIGNWILHKACNDYLDMKRIGLLEDNTWLSINISPVQIQSKDFVERVKLIIDECEMPKDLLHLEITESLLMEQCQHTLDTLKKIKTFGCRWVIDDFGVGYSSMEYLKNLPISILKIDKSFVMNCHLNSADKAITKAMISLAHNLNIKVVAEGVETENIASFLTQQYCDFVQGFLYCKPLTRAELEENLSFSREAISNRV